MIFAQVEVQTNKSPRLNTIKTRQLFDREQICLHSNIKEIQNIILHFGLQHPQKRVQTKLKHLLVVKAGMALMRAVRSEHVCSYCSAGP